MNQQQTPRVDSQARAQEILNRERNANQVIMRLKATQESYQEELQRLKAKVENQFGTSDLESLREKFRESVSNESRFFSEAEKAIAEVESLCADVTKRLNEINRS